MDTSKLSARELKRLEAEEPQKFELTRKLILNRAITGAALTEVEKDYLCSLIDPENVLKAVVDPIRENFDFRLSYLTYNDDLTGGRQYMNYKKEVISPAQAQAELKNLLSLAHQWKAQMQAGEASDRMLFHSLREANYHIGNFNNSSDFAQGIALAGRRRYDHGIEKIYLYSKYTYLLSKAIFETLEPAQLTLQLDGKSLSIDEGTLIHVISRHYAPLMGSYESIKSFHNQNFKPETLVYDLSEIFNNLNAAGGLNQPRLDQINFIFHGTPYRIYTTDRASNTNPIRISTFFPISDPAILNRLSSTHTVVKVDDSLSYYKQK